MLYNGVGVDDVDPKDFVLRFYANSSLFCNIAPTGHSFQLNDGGDSIHLIHSEKQIDFVKYRASDFPTLGAGNPGGLEWEAKSNGCVDVGIRVESTGIRFIGDKPDLNIYHATWQAFAETSLVDNNLGKPNGGRNTTWIENLRTAAKKKGLTSSDEQKGLGSTP